MNKSEVEAVRQVATDAAAIELDLLQLALVGGGTTDVTFC